MIATVTLNPALDRLVYVDHLQPNDTNRITKVETDVGGKGLNASRILRELECDTIALGFLGGKTGSFIRQALRIDGVKTEFVTIEGETRTVISVQESSGAPSTTLNECGPKITQDEIAELFAKVHDAAGRADMVLFGGSLPPGCPPDIYRELVKTVHGRGSKAILDADGEPMRLGMQACPFMIKPNRDEVKRLVDVDIRSMDDAKRALNLLAECGVQLTVISMGSKGAVAKYGDVIWYATPPEVNVVSTIGSGDSMVAGIACIIANGGSLDEALRYGSAAGAATAMSDGTCIGCRKDILSLLDKVKVEQLA